MPLKEQALDEMEVDNIDNKELMEIPSDEDFSKSKDEFEHIEQESDMDKNKLYFPFSKKIMRPIPDYPVVEEVQNTWVIDNWSGIKSDKLRGPEFECGGYTWNILLFPHGNNNNLVAIYIEPHPHEETDDWYVCAQFGLSIWNPNYPEAFLANGSYHRFNKNETDWGFSSFIDLKSLQSPNLLKGKTTHAILEGNKLNITACVRVIDDSSTGVLWHNFMNYDSKASTGYVGLNNQGATCYLNSLLQSYYTTKNFRKLVYEIPTEKDTNSVPLSLQRIFYQLQNSNDPVGTLELTKSFGWDSSDAFTQHDVQELNRILMDKLETAMKGTPIENELSNIFVGKMKSYIKCVNVPYESSREEDFWDIQLNVKGFKDLEESFRNYIEVEMLEGENKYQAGDQYGYQDAKKGVVFKSFPPVLHLQLKRFEYDFMIDDLVKIDDKYEFPDSIDLSPYFDDDLPSEVKSQNWTYKLHGVLVHQGSISNGHYYALIKPGTDDTWMRFDDDKVWKCTPNQVFYENFGANELDAEQLMKMTKVEQNEYIIRRSTSAYMLVYYRESELNNILPPNEDSINKAIPEHVPRKLKEELEEKLKFEKAKQEALYFINVKFVTRKNFNKYNGFDLYPDVTNELFYDPTLFSEKAHPLVLKVKRDEIFKNLYIQVGIKLGYLTEDVTKVDDLSTLPYRLIAMNHRNNHTNRPDTPVPDEMMNNSVIQVFFECFNRKYDEMSFYVEDLRDELHNVVSTLSSATQNEAKFQFENVFSRFDKLKIPEDQRFPNIYENSPYIMIFIKYFDPNEGEVRVLTHANVLKNSKINTLTEPITKLLGLSPDSKLAFYEELSPSKLEALQVDTTFEKGELSNGDIIVVESFESKANDLVSFPTVQSYYRFLLTRFHVRISPFNANSSSEDHEFVKEEEEGSKDGTDTHNEVEDQSKIAEFWVSVQVSHDEFAREISKHLGGDIDPNYLRIFAVNNQGITFPLKRSMNLSQIFNSPISAAQITNFQYEVLSIPLQEYENMKLIKFSWLTTLIHYQTFEFLVPKKSLVGDALMTKLLHKINISQSQVRNILLWSGVDHKYVDLIKFDREISTIPDNFELYGGVFPAEVETLVNFDMIKRYEGEIYNKENIPPLNPELEKVQEYELINVEKYNKRLNMIPGFHFHKNSSYHHGVPFIFPVFVNEKFSETKNRLRAKLGLGIKEFEKIKFALADVNDKGRYIDQKNEDFVLYDELKKHQEQLSIALDHPDRSPRRQSQFDRGISIK